jgi:GNAT superfamily N-acetyltransferase
MATKSFAQARSAVMRRAFVNLNGYGYYRNTKGKGLGYRMIQELLTFAKEAGYQRIVLETDPIHQKRAIEFYKGLGFYEILIPNARPEEDIQMEMIL